jgi:hypothetical protein
MPCIGYICKYRPKYYNPSHSVSEYSMHISSDYGLKSSFQPNAVHIFHCGTLVLFRNCIFWSNLTTQGWTHDDEHPWTDHGGSRIYGAFANPAICCPDQCRLRGRGKNGRRGIDSSDTCLRAELTMHCY